jgi:phospholipid/cholesterol/gamma-HCH transport system ATP-binding protein
MVERMQKNKKDSESVPLLEVKNVTFKRDGRYILKNVSFSLHKGNIVAVMGPSGTGKTTLLSLINALIKPDSGKILFKGIDMHELSLKDLYKVRSEIGHMFQNGALFSHLSVFDNVAFPLRENTNLTDDMIRDLVTLKLEAVGLRGVATKMPEQLSGGMARRVALARSTALDPELMLYDEPFTGQDPISSGVLTTSIMKMRDILNLTSIIVTHDLQAVTKVADVVHIIGSGEILASGSVAEILSSTDPAVVQFVSGAADGVIPFHYPTDKTLTQDLIYA